MVVMEFLASLFGASVGVAVIGFIGKNWIVLKIKTAIENETFLQRSIFELKRAACLEALEVSDAAMSNRTWRNNGDGEKVAVATQPLDIASARRAYNQLALTCKNPNIVELYAETLGLREPGEPLTPNKGDLIVDLRNEMRKELGFGKTLDFDRSKAWIANLGGAT